MSQIIVITVKGEQKKTKFMLNNHARVENESTKLQCDVAEIDGERERERASEREYEKEKLLLYKKGSDLSSPEAYNLLLNKC
jgi:hypothetical protein